MKKEYNKPKLTRHGTAQEITQGAFGGHSGGSRGHDCTGSDLGYGPDYKNPLVQRPGQ